MHERTSLTTPTTVVGYVIYYPKTEFVMWTGRWGVTIASYVMEAITDAFGADRILHQNIKGNAVKYLSHLIKIRKSQGVFAQLRNNTVDANPLDIRQKAGVDDDEAYVNKGEQSRRIRPVEDEEVRNRLALVMQNFGWEPVYGITSVDIDVRLPLASDDDGIRFKMNLSGASVPQGVKQFIKNGQFEMPVPSWMETIGATGITKYFVTKDGVSETEPEKEEEAVATETAENEGKEMVQDEDKDMEEVDNEEQVEDEVMEDDIINPSDDQDSIINGDVEEQEENKESDLSES
ncbi:MAG: hypothetical protein EXX96DRAFT_548559 [Benjaminiella poitrasii]|nr:MAG: hypothetical protein EXX96DRAFT_548559 [Benjaminiella poitrasii]